MRGRALAIDVSDGITKALTVDEEAAVPFVTQVPTRPLDTMATRSLLTCL